MGENGANIGDQFFETFGTTFMELPVELLANILGRLDLTAPYAARGKFDLQQCRSLIHTGTKRT